MLIILAITLLMAVATAVLAYFADFLPLVFDSGTQISTNVSVGTQQVTTTEG